VAIGYIIPILVNFIKKNLATLYWFMYSTIIRHSYLRQTMFLFFVVHNFCTQQDLSGNSKSTIV
jgi:hypothetical protein